MAIIVSANILARRLSCLIRCWTVIGLRNAWSPSEWSRLPSRTSVCVVWDRRRKYNRWFSCRQPVNNGRTHGNGNVDRTSAGLTVFGLAARAPSEHVLGHGVADVRETGEDCRTHGHLVDHVIVAGRRVQRHGPTGNNGGQTRRRRRETKRATDGERNKLLTGNETTIDGKRNGDLRETKPRRRREAKPRRRRERPARRRGGHDSGIRVINTSRDTPSSDAKRHQRPKRHGGLPERYHTVVARAILF